MYSHAQKFPCDTIARAYNYRAYLETLLTYGTDAASSQLSNCNWYLDAGDMYLVILQPINTLPPQTMDS